VFEYGHGLRLRVLSFDLDAEVLINADNIGLPLVQKAMGSIHATRTHPVAFSTLTARTSARMSQDP